MADDPFDAFLSQYDSPAPSTGLNAMPDAAKADPFDSYLSKFDSAPAPEAAPKETDSALAFSVDQAQRLAGQGVQAAEDFIGTGTSYGQQYVDQQDIDIKAGGYTPKYQGSLLDQDGIANMGGWLLEKLQENAAYSGVALAGAGAAAVTSSVSVPAALAVSGVTGLTTLAMGAGEVADEMKEKGVYSPGVALAGGFIISLLDRVGAGRVVPGSALTKLVGMGVKKEAAEQMVEEVVKKGLTRELVSRALAEGTTETAQEFVNVVAAASQGATYSGEELLNRGVDAAALGGAMGGAFAAPTIVAERISGAREAKAKADNLTEADRSSPIPDDLIDAGKQRLGDVDIKNNVDDALRGMGLPGTEAPVSIQMPDGTTSAGIIVDAVAGAEGRPETAVELFDEGGEVIGYFDPATKKQFPLGQDAATPGSVRVMLTGGEELTIPLDQINAPGGYGIAPILPISGPGPDNTPRLGGPEAPTGATTSYGDGFSVTPNGGTPQAALPAPDPNNITGEGFTSQRGPAAKTVNTNPRDGSLQFKADAEYDPSKKPPSAHRTGLDGVTNIALVTRARDSLAKKYGKRVRVDAGTLTIKNATDAENREAEAEVNRQAQAYVDRSQKARETAAKRDRTPKNLLEFIGSRGGVQDTGGDIKSMGGATWHKDKPFRKALIAAGTDAQGNMLGTLDTGDTSQEKTLTAAIEAGYLPEGSDLNDLIDAIGEAVRGNDAAAEPTTADIEAENRRQEEEADARRKDLSDEVRAAGRQFGEPLSSSDIVGIVKILEDTPGMDAIDAVETHIERLAIQAADEFKEATGDAEYEIPFDPAEVAASVESGDGEGQPGQAADTGAAGEGATAAPDAEQAGQQEGGKPLDEDSAREVMQGIIDDRSGGDPERVSGGFFGGGEYGTVNYTSTKQYAENHLVGGPRKKGLLQISNEYKKVFSWPISEFAKEKTAAEAAPASDFDSLFDTALDDEFSGGEAAAPPAGPRVFINMVGRDGQTDAERGGPLPPETGGSPAPLYIEDFSEKAIIVKGQTKEYIGRIKNAIGRKPLWNRRAGGWIFRKADEAVVRKALANLLVGNPDPITDDNPTTTAPPIGERDGWPQTFVAEGREFNGRVFSSDDAANRFISDNSGWGVAKTEGLNVYVARKNDRGKRVAGGQAVSDKFTADTPTWAEILAAATAAGIDVYDIFPIMSEIADRKIEKFNQLRPAQITELMDRITASAKPPISGPRAAGEVPSGYELGDVSKISDAEEARRKGGNIKVVVRRKSPWSVVDGYGDTREAAIDNAMGKFQPRAAAEAAASAVKNTAKGIDDVTAGLAALFGDKNTLGSGPTFDPDTYAKAKPLFLAGVQHFAAAGRDVKDLIAALVKHLSASGMTRQAIENMRPYVRRFIEDIEAGAIDIREKAPEDEPAAAPQDVTALRQLADAFADAFKDRTAFKTIVQARQFAKDVTGQDYASGTPEAKQLEEAIEAGLVKEARRIAAGSDSAEDSYDAMVGLYNRQPNLAERTSTSIENQAYSTPAPLAYLAAHLAGIGSRTTVLEPAAGNGMLMMTAAPSNITANELNPSRVEALRMNYTGATITEGDATATMPAGPFDAVITNPPFGKVLSDQGEAKVFDVDGDIRTKEIDHAIAWKALKSMKPGGRAVLIIGGKQGSEDERRQAYRADATRRFFKKLFDAYNVVDHFTLDGRLYQRQGAGWPVDVVVIEGTGQSGIDMPMKTPPRIYNTWEALRGVLDEDADLEPAGQPNGNGNGAAGAEAGAGLDPADVRGRPGSPDSGDGDAGTGAGGRPDAPAAGSGGRAGVSDQSDLFGGPSGRDPATDGAVAGTGGAAGTDGSAQPASEAERPGNGDSIAGGSSDGLSSDPVPERVAPGRVDRDNQEAETDHQVQYAPTSNARFAVGTLVPKNMQTAMAQALEALAERVGDIDTFVAEKLDYSLSEMLGTDAKPGYFSAEQVDAIALAIDNVEKGAGFIIGDQTGVGKGRFVAAMLRYGKVNGRTPVFVTKSPGLFGDMIRDMRDIGMADAHTKALMTNSDLRGAKGIPLSRDPGDTLLSLPKAKLDTAINHIIKNGSLPNGMDYFFTTYSQMNFGGNGKRYPRHDALESVASNAMIVLDESHEAGGSDTKKFNKDGDEIPSRADFVRDLLTKSDGAIYSSATYAKNPTVMSLYFKTDLSIGVPNRDDLAGTIAAGGVPLQQAVANMLVESGQYARRERSFEGVEMNMDVLPTDPAQAEVAALTIQEVFSLDRDFMEGTREAYIDEQESQGELGGRDNAVGGNSIASVGFANVMHNVVSQMLLALKAPATVDKAIELVRQGEKPIIAITNTNGSIIDDFVKANSIGNGDRADLTFNTILDRYLQRLRRLTLKDADGNKRHVWLSDADISRLGGPFALSEFKRAERAVRDADFEGMPASPVDYILDRLRAEGIKANEITGRHSIIADGVLTKRQPSDAEKKRVMNAYNSGDLDALVINQSGATGFSMHATDKADNDGKQRHMIVLQPDPNIDTFMQMLGRIHRTGQIKLPKYTIAVSDLSAEKRLAANLMKKMASLNANTTASKRSAVSLDNVTDFLNKYGDMVVFEYLKENDTLAAFLGVDIGEGPTDGMALRFTGRLAILSPARVSEIYDDIEASYTKFIENLDRMGMNTLEAKTLELEAETTRREVLVAATDSSSPFGSAAIVETVKAKRLGKPYSEAELDDLLDIARGSDEVNNADVLNDLVVSHNADIDQSIETAKANLADAKTDKQKDRAADQIQRYVTKQAETSAGVQVVIDLMDRLSVGAPVVLTYTEGESSVEVPAISLGIDVSGITNNPSARSRMYARLAIADAGQEVQIPVTKMLGENPQYSTTPTRLETVKFAFEAGISDVREERQIITGNILSGYNAFKRGLITMFTDSDGRVRQGILMPKSFNAAAAVDSLPAEFKDGQQIAEFLSGSDSRLVKTADKIMHISRMSNGDYRLAVSTKGGKVYYLNRQVRNLVGEFQQRRGQRVFSATFSGTDTLNKVVAAYQDNLDTKFITDTNKEAARAITGESGLKEVEDDAGAANGAARSAAEGDKYSVRRPRPGTDAASLGGTLAGRLERYGLGGKIGIAFFDGLDGKFPDGSKNAIDGFYRSRERLIGIALDAKDANWTFDHETIHALRDIGVLRDLEWRALAAAAKADTARMNEIRRAYPGLSEDALIEEAVADMFADWNAGRAQPGGPLKRAWERVKSFLKALAGVPGVDDVFEKVASGQIGRRDPAGVAASDSGRGPNQDGPQFKRWFSGSKVVDPQGNPLTVYHGTIEDVTAFDPAMGGRRTGANSAKLGFFFATDPAVASSYAKGFNAYQESPLLRTIDKITGGRYSRINERMAKAIGAEPGIRDDGVVMPVNLAIKNPYVVDFKGGDYREKSYTAVIKDARAEGHDGVVLRNTVDPGFTEEDGSNNVTDVWVAFDPTQIKSTLNKGSYDREDPDIRYSRRDRTNPFTEMATEPNRSIMEEAGRRGSILERLRGATSADAFKETADRLRTAFQDAYLPLLRAQRAIEEQTGRRLSPDEDAYRIEELSSGRKGAKIEDLHESRIEPLLDAMHAAGVSIEEMEAYLYARHAPERNARISEINPNFAPGEGSGMTDAEAEAIMAGVRQAGKSQAMARLAAKVDDILRYGVEQRVEAGLMTQEQADVWAGQYEHYVPLRGEGELDPDLAVDRPRQGGSGVSVSGKESFQAFGRKTPARDILAFAIMQTEEAIIRGETNRVAVALVKMAEANQSPDFWTVDKIATRPVLSKVTNMVEYRPTKALLAEDRDYTVSAKIGGVEHRVTFNRRNPNAARLAAAMKNMNGEQLTLFTVFFGKINRWLSTVNTTLNPEFLIVNAFRDIQTAAFNLNAVDRERMVRQTLKNYFPALKGSMKGSFGDRGSDAWTRTYEEFRQAGGRVYFNRVDDVNQLRTRLERDFANAKPGITAKKAIKTLFEVIEQANLGVENAVRLAAFKTARDNGMSVSDAASLAKNLTVNFNRKGHLGSFMNSLYLFFNASVQGSAVLLRAGKSKRVQKVLLGAVVAGAAIEALNAFMLDDDDKDGESLYDKTSDYDKSRNLIFMLPGSGGSKIKVPLPYGYNVFFAAGRSMVELGRGKKPMDVMSALGSTIADSFNPIGGSESLLNFISPTIADPIVDLAQNRDYADRPIMPEQSQFGAQVPESQRYWGSVSKTSKAITDALNVVTGGDEVRPGLVDVSPEVLDHLFGVATGAAGTFYGRTADTILKVVDPTSELTINDIPVARKLVGTKPSYFDKAAFYDRAGEVEQLRADYKDYRQRGMNDKAAALLEENRGAMGLLDASKATKKSLKAIRKKRDILGKRLAAEEITRELYTKEFNALRETEAGILTRFNSMYISKTQK